MMRYHLIGGRVRGDGENYSIFVPELWDVELPSGLGDRFMELRSARNWAKKWEVAAWRGPRLAAVDVMGNGLLHSLRSHTVGHVYPREGRHSKFQVSDSLSDLENG